MTILFNEASTVQEKIVAVLVESVDLGLNRISIPQNNPYVKVSIKSGNVYITIEIGRGDVTKEHEIVSVKVIDPHVTASDIIEFLKENDVDIPDDVNNSRAYFNGFLDQFISYITDMESIILDKEYIGQKVEFLKDIKIKVNYKFDEIN